jgi:hypothetical protein
MWDVYVNKCGFLIGMFKSKITTGSANPAAWNERLVHSNEVQLYRHYAIDSVSSVLYNGCFAIFWFKTHFKIFIRKMVL